MKFLATLVTFALLITLNANAFERDLFSSVRGQVENYYESTGEWALVKIKKIQEVETDSSEFRLFAIKTYIQRKDNSSIKNETCLVTFVANENEFFAINCF